MNQATNEKNLRVQHYNQLINNTQRPQKHYKFENNFNGLVRNTKNNVDIEDLLSCAFECTN
jgi:hypothetical protein